jgi:hypothetical protein
MLRPTAQIPNMFSFDRTAQTRSDLPHGSHEHARSYSRREAVFFLAEGGSKIIHYPQPCTTRFARVHGGAMDIPSRNPSLEWYMPCTRTQ